METKKTFDEMNEELLNLRLDLAASLTKDHELHARCKAWDKRNDPGDCFRLWKMREESIDYQILWNKTLECERDRRRINARIAFFENAIKWAIANAECCARTPVVETIVKTQFLRRTNMKTVLRILDDIGENRYELGALSKDARAAEKMVKTYNITIQDATCIVNMSLSLTNSMELIIRGGDSNYYTLYVDKISAYTKNTILQDCKTSRLLIVAQDEDYCMVSGLGENSRHEIKEGDFVFVAPPQSSVSRAWIALDYALRNNPRQKFDL